MVARIHEETGKNCLIMDGLTYYPQTGGCIDCPLLLFFLLFSTIFLYFIVWIVGSNKISSNLDWETRLRIALEAAKGLEYLHEHVSPPVIHRDFKSSNILLDKDFHAKVSDFGLAKIGSDKAGGHVSTRVLGTQGYVAPE